MANITLLHIYNQTQWHTEAWIVGNRAGLESLRYAVTQALVAADGLGQTPTADGCVFASDGEGYSVMVVREDGPWNNHPDKTPTVWDRLAMPYSDDYARGPEVPGVDVLSPAQLWIERDRK